MTPDLQRRYAEWASKQEPRLPFNLNAAPPSAKPLGADVNLSAVSAPINAATQELPAVNSASRMATQGNGYRPKSARDDSTGAVGTTLTTPLRDSAQCPASAAPINAAPQRVLGPSAASLTLEATDAKRCAGGYTGPTGPRTSNELLALARSWDLWGGAAFVLFVVWMAVSSVFSIA